MHAYLRNHRQNRSRRRGAVTVEFALVASMLFMVIFAGLEFSRANMIRNTIENAAYEGARQGILPGATAAECTTAAQSYLGVVGISSSTVTATPAVLTGASDVTVTVNVPMSSANSYGVPTFFAGKTLSSSITLPREGN